jgi:hypothetical protein
MKFPGGNSNPTSASSRGVSRFKPPRVFINASFLYINGFREVFAREASDLPQLAHSPYQDCYLTPPENEMCELQSSIEFTDEIAPENAVEEVYREPWLFRNLLPGAGGQQGVGDVLTGTVRLMLEGNEHFGVDADGLVVEVRQGGHVFVGNGWDVEAVRGWFGEGLGKGDCPWLSQERYSIFEGDLAALSTDYEGTS